MRTGTSTREVHNLDDLRVVLDEVDSLSGVRLQGLDLTDMVSDLLAHPDVRGLAVLGGRVPGRLARSLSARGAVVFPEVPDAPVDPYRAVLYHPTDLYAGLSAHGYAATPDSRAYDWAQDADAAHDALVTAVRALHDDAMSDALAETLRGQRAIGVMGGHGLRRGTPEFALAARLGQALAGTGRIVLTGGGPGAMEAANLGAFAGPMVDLTEPLARLATQPDFSNIDGWARVAFQVRDDLVRADPERIVSTGSDGPNSANGAQGGGRAARAMRSIGIPTWFYGHEPPNVFCDGIAKYFSNALREDGLLALSTGGVIALPGAAGTVQEIFQAVTPRYYDTGKSPVPALVLVGVEHWTTKVPVWPLLQTMAQGRAFSSRTHLVDSVDEVLPLLAD